MTPEHQMTHDNLENRLKYVETEMAQLRLKVSTLELGLKPKSFLHRLIWWSR